MSFMEKNEIRKLIKTRLSSPAVSLEKQSLIVKEKICNSSEYKSASLIFAYMALPDELDLTPLIEQAFKDGKKVYIPRIISGTSDMDFYEAGSAVSKGSFGILEPEPTEEKRFKKEEISSYENKILVLVPGRAFTKGGGRVGRGKGFYDKYLRIMKDTCPFKEHLFFAGVCFSEQIFEEGDIVLSSYDIPMDLLFFTLSGVDF